MATEEIVERRTGQLRERGEERYRTNELFPNGLGLQKDFITLATELIALRERVKALEAKYESNVHPHFPPGNWVGGAPGSLETSPETR